MNLLYLDSKYLSFKFELIKGPHQSDIIDNFESLSQVSDYFNDNADYDLVLYNPYIFIQLIEDYDFDPQSFLSSKGFKVIPYVNPKDILPISREMENKLISLFPPGVGSEKYDISSDYKGKCVLVTGAGGSIGSELVLQLLQSGVALCICLDLSEYSVFNLKQKINEFKKDNFEIIVGSYGDINLLESIFSKNSVDIVINASAYKHVSIMQSNPYAAFKNNVINFLKLLKTASSFGVNNIIQVSTDKAAEPSNVMGFSKLLCEQILINANKYLDTSLNYSIVRFGNVVGSSGSVVPIFIDNIKEGNKLRITHNDVERFMMQISDAVELILHAARNRKNETYILDMGKPYRIKDLAVKVIKNSHFSYDESLIKFTGLQVGEKLSEVLFTSVEGNNMNKQDGIFVITNRDEELLSPKEMELLFSGEIEFLYEKIKNI